MDRSSSSNDAANVPPSEGEQQENILKECRSIFARLNSDSAAPPRTKRKFITVPLSKQKIETSQKALETLKKRVMNMRGTLNQSYDESMVAAEVNAKQMVRLVMEAKQAALESIEEVSTAKMQQLTDINRKLQAHMEKMERLIEFATPLTPVELLFMDSSIGQQIREFEAFVEKTTATLEEPWDMGLAAFNRAEAIEELSCLVVPMILSRSRNTSSRVSECESMASAWSSMSSEHFSGSTETLAAPVHFPHNPNPPGGYAHFEEPVCQQYRLPPSPFEQSERRTSESEMATGLSDDSQDFQMPQQLLQLGHFEDDIDVQDFRTVTQSGRCESIVKRPTMYYTWKIGEYGQLPGQFTEPSGIAVTPRWDIVVADTNNHRIQVFDSSGNFKFQFGERGHLPGQMLYPSRVAINPATSDFVVIERAPTRQVQIFNQFGVFITKFGSQILKHPRGVCVDERHQIIVLECKVKRIVIFDYCGNVLNRFARFDQLEFPNSVCAVDNEIYVCDNRGHCVKVFGYDGSYRRQIGGEGLTNYPIAVSINSRRQIVISDNHNNFNVTIFNLNGEIVRAYESKVKHAQGFDVALLDDGSVVFASKDYRVYMYRFSSCK
ncbi:hypothetical protein L596_009206 [Steinernema carpocapsae]|uniref:B-box C-terminal domain-containing protein n=1 Tax=Steinernema carpocapsae TaxID=34508 RepID=A0A4U5PFH3_STECR|nr:hypothetical protein L596_009206 [Steinernema carpocapsae]